MVKGGAFDRAEVATRDPIRVKNYENIFGLIVNHYLGEIHQSDI
jgi:hypothetical protein